jgi:hypothetical protein
VLLVAGFGGALVSLVIILLALPVMSFHSKLKRQHQVAALFFWRISLGLFRFSFYIFARAIHRGVYILENNTRWSHLGGRVGFEKGNENFFFKREMGKKREEKKIDIKGKYDPKKGK